MTTSFHTTAFQNTAASELSECTLSTESETYPHMKTIDKSSLDNIISILKQEGYIVVGPMIKDGAIVYDEISGTPDMPVGWGDVQEAGTYSLVKRNDDAIFGYAVGPQSWKKFLFPPKLKLWAAERTGKGFELAAADENIPKYAFIGVRACELKAILIQDKVFDNGMFADSYYNNIRKNIFIAAVNCTVSSNTCFCVSMHTGPKVKDGYDIALTEVINDNEHYFTLEEGSPKGCALTAKLESKSATGDEEKAAEEAINMAVHGMTRKLNTEGIKELLYGNHNSPVWDDVAARCLTCANCTMVCPTCFCSNVEDTTDLTGDHAERWRKWDSCFSLDYSKVAGGNFRTSPKARYRQWMTHKLASWIDQFGTSGCVGCGRCITWCPVGIDITKEAEKIRVTDLRNKDVTTAAVNNL